MSAEARYSNVFERLIARWYLQPLAALWDSLTASQRQNVRRQAWLGLFQTLVLVIAVTQSLFAGVLRALPAETRAALGFLHRIEWGVYAGIVLILAQVIIGWGDQFCLTNRLGLLAWPLGKARLLKGRTARQAQLVYLVLAILMVVEALYVRANGFIFQNLPPAR